MKFTVSEDVEIVANGQRILLEAGDEVAIEDQQDINSRIAEAFEASKDIPGHLDGLFKARNGGAGGSKFDTPQTIESLISADWVSYNHPAVMKGVDAFKASIPGYVGLIKLDELPDNQVVELIDGHKTGFLSVVINGKRAEHVDFTVLMLGQDSGKEVVFTFHPGDPIRPSSLPDGGEFSKGDKITVQQAKNLGFEYAKVRD
jgi:hypothetical protein